MFYSATFVIFLFIGRIMNNILAFCIVNIERRSVLLLLIGLIICRINTFLFQ